VDDAGSVDDFFDGPSSPRSARRPPGAVPLPGLSPGLSPRVVRLGGSKSAAFGSGSTGSPTSGGDVEILQSRSPSVFS
jgi:hypothetical protein